MKRLEDGTLITTRTELRQAIENHDREMEEWRNGYRVLNAGLSPTPRIFTEQEFIGGGIVLRAPGMTEEEVREAHARAGRPYESPSVWPLNTKDNQV